MKKSPLFYILHTLSKLVYPVSILFQTAFLRVFRLFMDMFAGSAKTGRTSKHVHRISG